MYKTCPKCNKHKKLENYHKQKGGSYGRHSICKECRSIIRKKCNLNNIKRKVVPDTKICTLCCKSKKNKEFYKNNSSKDGLQTYCKKCQIKKISLSQSKIENFAKIILNKYIKKHKNLEIKINVKDITKKFNDQKGLCHVTQHKMTHNTDLKQRTDNIWNMAILITNNKAKKITFNDFHLVIHLIYTTKELYGMSIDQVKKLYKKLL